MKGSGNEEDKEKNERKITFNGMLRGNTGQHSKTLRQSEIDAHIRFISTLKTYT